MSTTSHESLGTRAVNRFRRIWKSFADSLPGAKGRAELHYWKQRKNEEGDLRNAHYEFLYLTHFGLKPADYDGKRVLDIGCGPRGSLEWADMAAERVGVDPLVDDYLKLGADQHKMRYAKSGVEHMPFEDGHFDFVCTFNSLDHVDDIDEAIREIKRITKPGGTLLLLVEVNHEPTVCEPVTLGWDLPDRFAPEFEPVKVEHFEYNKDGMRAALTGPKYDHNDTRLRVGVLSAMFRRV